MKITPTNSVCCLTLAVILAMFLSGTPRVLATPDQGANCAGCHSDIPVNSQTGMTVTNFQRTADLGAGTFNVFRVSPGQTVAIQFNATDNNGGNYGLAVEGLDAAGQTNSAHHLAFTADPTWTSRSSASYFTVGPLATIPDLWTFNLAILANTPADSYVVQVQMAGLNSSSALWDQSESFYVEVVSVTPPVPLITGISHSGNSLTVQVGTAVGFTYFLDYKLSLSAASWLTATQGAGSGVIVPLTDNAATNQQRFYRIRVQ